MKQMFFSVFPVLTHGRPLGPSGIERPFVPRKKILVAVVKNEADMLFAFDVSKEEVYYYFFLRYLKMDGCWSTDYSS